MLRKELIVYPTIMEYFWTYSDVVLGYVSNDAKRFKIFVASRVQLNREDSDVSHWMLAVSNSDSAGDISPGISPSS